MLIFKDLSNLLSIHVHCIQMNNSGKNQTLDKLHHI